MILIIHAHPYPQRSRAGRAFLEAVRDLRPAGETLPLGGEQRRGGGVVSALS
ncbi:MAG TPA: hypothetical protein PLD53_04740 [Candidatus Propionivibrio aalborgensis]|nr:hypothetical protein [Candidatus Propionivibrio aalborgensis]